MTVFLNDKSTEVPEGILLPVFLESLQLPTLDGLAIAVNEMVIPRASWVAYALNNNDKILLIKATQGG